MRNSKTVAGWMAGILFSVTLGLAWAPSVAAAECPNAQSDPYPFGECGDDNEYRVWCYVVVRGQRVSGTDDTAMALPDPANPSYYLRSAPAQAFMNDPNSAPLPTQQLFAESNDLPGLQPKAVTCQNYVWWDRCNFWMDTGSSWKIPADTLIA